MREDVSIGDGSRKIDWLYRVFSNAVTVRLLP